ncbi:MAG: DUF4276 family protein [Deltaproteobacteria bacterium]|jgi:hypothetical protein|nr:DUF4276 family protein [Deltaproteobacteria bacterium]
MIVHLILEGHLEEPVADKLLLYCGHQKGNIYGRQGCGYISKKIFSLQALARYGCGVLVLTDLRDSRTPCPSEALKRYKIVSPPANFLCRFAVFELESWLLADREALAKFLGIAVKHIPSSPDGEIFPKRTMVSLANRSKKKSIQTGVVPEPSHGGVVAPGYLATMTEFVIDYWDVASAMRNSPSLNRCIERLQGLRVE